MKPAAAIQISHLLRGRKCFPEQHHILLKSHCPGLWHTACSRVPILSLALKLHRCVLSWQAATPWARTISPKVSVKEPSSRGSCSSHPSWLQVFPNRTRTPFLIYDFKNMIASPLLLFSHWVTCDSVTPWTATHQASLSLSSSRSLLKLTSVESLKPSNHLILCRPLLLLPIVFPSIRVFSNESALHIRWPKYWSFSFSVIPANEHSGLISFRMDWFDLLVVQGTLRSLLQHQFESISSLLLSLLPPDQIKWARVAAVI